MAYKISSSTFSISSPVVIKNGTEGYGKILTTDASGLLVWKEPNSFFGQSRYIGELYGGGIVVDFWKEGDVENTLIMSLTHLSYDYIWSNIETFSADYFNYYGTGADSIYDGRYNSDKITSHIVYDPFGDFTIYESHTMSAAKMCKDYNYGGYDDWYLPSYNEFNSIVKNKNIINRVLGDVDGIRSQNTGSGSALSGLYWTSNEYTETVSSGGAFPTYTTTYYALQYSTSESKFKTALKTSNSMVRAVRKEEKLTGNGLVLSLDAGNKNSYDDSTRGNIWYDLVNKGITASAGLTFSASATGVTYSATNSGYLKFQSNTTSYIDFKANLDNTSVVTIEMFARLKNINGNIFAWNNGYYNIMQNGDALGFYTGSGDLYGIIPTKSIDYGLLNNWKHYIFVMRTDVSYTNNKIYINGDQIDLGVVNSAIEQPKSFLNGSGRINTPSAGFGQGAGMDLAIFNVYKRELNKTEILNNFNKYKKRFEVKDTPYQKDLILNVNSNNINSFNPTNLTVWNDTKFSSDTRTLKPLTFASTANYTKSDGVYPGTYINFNNNRASVATTITFTYSTTWETWVKFDSILPTLNMFMGQTLPYFNVQGSFDNKIIFSNSYSGAAGGSNQTYHYSNSSIVTGKWYHLVFTTKYDSVSNKTSSRIYINGNPDYSNTINTNLDTGGVTYDSNSIPGYQQNIFASNRFSVGDGRETNWYPFNGSIAEVRIYNRALNASEIENNYNSSKHLYDIDKNHNTHNFNTSPTFSIFQNLTLDFPTKQNNSFLVSDGNGLVSLSTPSSILNDKVYKRSVGELYAGGIIVSVVDYLSSTNYLIASLEDLTSTCYWSTLAGSQSVNDYLDTNEFDGSYNTGLIKTSFGTGSYAAMTASVYKYGGYTDWYLPSTNELREAYNNSDIINLSLGKNSLSGTYWSSSEANFGTNISGSTYYKTAFAFNFGSLYSLVPSTVSGLGSDGATSSGLEFQVGKYNKFKVRPFRTEVDSNSTAFITLWRTNNSGTSATNQITIPTSGTGYNYNVDWGDGTTSSGLTGNIIHTYASPGDYIVKITGLFPRIFFNGGLDRLKILEVKNWGSIKWKNMQSAFMSCSNLTITALDAPDLSNVLDMSYAFFGCTSFNQSINHWNVSNITSLYVTFFDCTSFNQPLNSWNTSAVTNMSNMFRGASVFNQPLNSWNTSAVTTMSNMFDGASVFNQPLNSWNTANVNTMSNMFSNAIAFNNGLAPGVSGSLNLDTHLVTNMSSMFQQASSFNQTLTTSGNIWNTSLVNDMSYMFYGATVFNNGLSTGVSGSLNLDTHLVTNMASMFQSTSAFNQTLTTSGNIWNVSAVTNMSGMFTNSLLFNQPLNSWNTIAVDNMQSMFNGASVFNQPLNSWNTSNVTNMLAMFQYASAFNQPLNSWNTSKVNNMGYMFYAASVFNNGLALGISGPLTFDTHLVTNMTNMFDSAYGFNQTLTTSVNIWNVSAVTNMNFMFANAIRFNQSLNSWSTTVVNTMFGMFSSATVFNNGLSSGVSGSLNLDTHLVTNMQNMFLSTPAFNQSLTTNVNIWNVSSVTNMQSMFNGASVFNQPLNSWNTSNVTNMSTMFQSATAFNQNIGSWNVSNVINFLNFMSTKTNLTFSTTNLDAIYVGWASRPVKPSITISFGSAKRTAASTTARGVLTASPNLWIITDGGI